MSTYDISELEAAMYETLVPGKPQIKVAKLIARTFRGQDLPPDDVVDAALERLVMCDDTQSFGLIKRWRHSEIKRLSADAV